MGSLIAKAALAYFEAHPDQIVNLFAEAADWAITSLKKHNAAQKAALVAPPAAQ